MVNFFKDYKTCLFTELIVILKMTLETLNSSDYRWALWHSVPIYPYGRRRTLVTEVIKDRIWTFEQVQGIFYVVVPIRMTVVKLEEGGLLIYAPVAPTPECIRLLRELEKEHDQVKYIILPTISGIEHKVFVGPFSRYFPSAIVYIAPDQWSFPINLPLSWLGLPLNRTKKLPKNSQETPFSNQFDYEILGCLNLGIGKFEEVAFLDKSTGTLLVTDILISVPKTPPAIVQLEPYPLLFHAKDTAFDSPDNTFLNRQKGWQRICLFALYFTPSVLQTRPWGQVFKNAWKSVDRSKRNYFGLYPFLWLNNWENSFNSLHNRGHLFVAPILQTLILNREPETVLQWVKKVSQWTFNQVIPCHFDSPIQGNGEDVQQAFSFLNPSQWGNYRLPQSDFELLKKIDRTLSKSGLVPPPATL